MDEVGIQKFQKVKQNFTSSNFSYLIPPNVYPGRIGLLLTTFLMLTNMFIGVTQTSPTCGGINQSQLWLLSCIIFVFSSSMVYFIILLQMEFSQCTSCKRIKYEGRHFLDNAGLILSPLLFSAFVAIYFTFITSKEL